jgi:hypothetical protein
MKIKGLIIVVLVIAATTVNGQFKNKTKEIKVTNITTTATGSATQTPAQVKQMAIDKAKIEALKQAGIEENINSYSDYFRSENENKMSELFVSDILSDIRGSVKDVTEVSSQMSFTSEGHIKVEVTINCTVVKYDVSRDLTYDIKVDGISMMYKEGDLFTFKITPYGDGFLRVFMFATEAFVLFPNSYEKSFQMISGQAYDFPQKVTLTLDAGGKKRETNRVVMVYLKQDIPYTGETDYKQITDWIMTIPPDERVIKSFGFEVVKY